MTLLGILWNYDFSHFRLICRNYETKWSICVFMMLFTFLHMPGFIFIFRTADKQHRALGRWKTHRNTRISLKFFSTSATKYCSKFFAFCKRNRNSPQSTLLKESSSSTRFGFGEQKDCLQEGNSQRCMEDYIGRNQIKAQFNGIYWK